MKMNKNKRLDEITQLIPDNSENEALLSIKTIVKIPYSLKLQLSCYLSKKFIIHLTAERIGNAITISAEGYKTVFANDTNLISLLKKFIYELDEAIAESSFIPGKKKLDEIAPDYPAPTNMDIPIWDNIKKQWFDAE